MINLLHPKSILIIILSTFLHEKGKFIMTSILKDITLAPSGQAKINWVREHMPILRHIEEVFRKEKPFAGKRVSICLHLEAKTAYMALVIQAGGAEVAAPPGGSGTVDGDHEHPLPGACAAGGRQSHPPGRESPPHVRDGDPDHERGEPGGGLRRGGPDLRH